MHEEPIVSDIHADTFSRSGGAVDFRQYWRGVFEGGSQADTLLSPGTCKTTSTPRLKICVSFSSWHAGGIRPFTAPRGTMITGLDAMPTPSA